MPRFLTWRGIAAAASATIMTFSLAGCGGTPNPSSSPSTSPAESDKKVTLYSGRDEKLVQPLIDKFTADTGIKVDVRYGSTAELAAQLIEEGDKSPAQVYFAQDAGALAAVSKAKRLALLPAATVEKVPATYRAKDASWVGVTGRSRVLTYNRAKVPVDKLPASVFDLVKPEWKGRVGVAPTNASFQSFVTAMRVEHGADKTREWLKALAANSPQIREKNGAIVKDVAAGTIDVGLVNHYYIVQSAKEAGKPIDKFPAGLHFFGNGDVGGLVNVTGVALVGKQPDADGQALVDYLLGAKAQEAFRDNTGEYPLVSSVKGPEGLPALDSLKSPAIDLNDLGGLQETVKMISEAGLS